MILDTETTGISAEDEIIELAIIDTRGQEKVNTLIQCQMETIPLEAKKVHGISEQKLRNDGRTWPQIWDRLMNFLLRKELVIYNAEYDLRMLRQTAKRYGFTMPDLQAHCLMKKYAEYVGARAESGEFRPMRLSVACSHFQVKDEPTHRAFDDCQATLSVLRGLARYATDAQNDQAGTHLCE